MMNTAVATSHGGATPLGGQSEAHGPVLAASLAAPLHPTPLRPAGAALLQQPDAQTQGQAQAQAQAQAEGSEQAPVRQEARRGQQMGANATHPGPIVRATSAPPQLALQGLLQSDSESGAAGPGGELGGGDLNEPGGPGSGASHPAGGGGIGFHTAYASHASGGGGIGTMADGTALIINGEVIHPNDERLSQDYYTYYFSQKPLDPRLRPPLLNWSNYHPRHGSFDTRQRVVDSPQLSSAAASALLGPTAADLSTLSALDDLQDAQTPVQSAAAAGAGSSSSIPPAAASTPASDPSPSMLSGAGAGGTGEHDLQRRVAGMSIATTQSDGAHMQQQQQQQQAYQLQQLQQQIYQQQQQSQPVNYYTGSHTPITPQSPQISLYYPPSPQLAPLDPSAYSNPAAFAFLLSQQQQQQQQQPQANQQYSANMRGPPNPSLIAFMNYQQQQQGNARGGGGGSNTVSASLLSAMQQQQPQQPPSQAQQRVPASPAEIAATMEIYQRMRHQQRHQHNQHSQPNQPHSNHRSGRQHGSRSNAQQQALQQAYGVYEQPHAHVPHRGGRGGHRHQQQLLQQQQLQQQQAAAAAAAQFGVTPLPPQTLPLMHMAMDGSVQHAVLHTAAMPHLPSHGSPAHTHASGLPSVPVPIPAQVPPPHFVPLPVAAATVAAPHVVAAPPTPPHTLVWFDDFRHSKTNAHLTLADVLARGVLVPLASDQHGSRFLQQKLEHASTSASDKQAAFEAVLPEVIRLAHDVFGNYVIQKFLEHGTQPQRRQLCSMLRGHVLPLSLHMYGCRVIQKCFDVCSDKGNKEEEATTTEKGESGQQADGVGPPANEASAATAHSATPAAAALASSATSNGTSASAPTAAPASATSPSSSRSPPLLDCALAFVSELSPHVLQLVRDQNGNHVIQKVIERVPMREIEPILDVFQQHVFALSVHPFGCRVIQRLLEHCTSALRLQRILDDILLHVDDLCRNQYGNYVIQHILVQGAPEARRDVLRAITGVGAASTTTEGEGETSEGDVTKGHAAGAAAAGTDGATSPGAPSAHGDSRNGIIDHVVAAASHGHAATSVPPSSPPSSSPALLSSPPVAPSTTPAPHPGRVLQFAKHKFASNVIEKCWLHAGPSERRELMDQMMGRESDRVTESLSTPFLSLVKDQYGNYVCQKMLDECNEEERASMIARIRKQGAHLRKHIIAKIEKLTGAPFQ